MLREHTMVTYSDAFYVVSNKSVFDVSSVRSQAFE